MKNISIVFILLLGLFINSTFAQRDHLLIVDDGNRYNNCAQALDLRSTVTFSMNVLLDGTDYSPFRLMVTDLSSGVRVGLSNPIELNFVDWTFSHYCPNDNNPILPIYTREIVLTLDFTGLTCNPPIGQSNREVLFSLVQEHSDGFGFYAPYKDDSDGGIPEIFPFLCFGHDPHEEDAFTQKAQICINCDDDSETVPDGGDGGDTSGPQGGDIVIVGGDQQQDQGSSKGNLGKINNNSTLLGDVLEQDVNSGRSIKVYPNPFNTNLFIEAPISLEQNIFLEIRSLNGTVILQNHYQSNELNVNLADLPTGIYFLHVWDGEHSMREKIIKN